MEGLNFFVQYPKVITCFYTIDLLEHANNYYGFCFNDTIKSKSIAMLLGKIDETNLCQCYWEKINKINL